MADFSAVALQTVATNQNVLFTNAETYSCRARQNIIFNEGSGLITLRGNQRPCEPCARYKVSFGANIAVPTGGTAGAISLALSQNGEALLNTNAIVTPAAVAEFFNVSRTVEITVPSGCCQQIALKNTSTQDISVQNANITVERVC